MLTTITDQLWKMDDIIWRWVQILLTSSGKWMISFGGEYRYYWPTLEDVYYHLEVSTDITEQLWVMDDIIWRSVWILQINCAGWMISFGGEYICYRPIMEYRWYQFEVSSLTGVIDQLWKIGNITWRWVTVQILQTNRGWWMILIGGEYRYYSPTV